MSPFSATSRRTWRSIVTEYDLGDDPAGLQLLTFALEAVDRANAARSALDQNGTTYMDRFGQPRARPEVAIERDSVIRAARCFRELGLEVDDSTGGAEHDRPARLGLRSVS